MRDAVADVPPDPVVDAFRTLPTAAVSDALDRKRLPGSAHGVAPLSDRARVVGRAFTVRYAPPGTPPGTAGDYIDDVPPGSVVVLDNGACTDCTVWGDILTSVASRHGIAGTVIWGVCRDVSKALDIAYPIYSASAGRFMRTGKDRVEVAEIGGPVTVGDVQVKPGDLIVADADGVVVVPQAMAADIAGLARTISDVEDSILAEALKPGVTLRAARAANHYHSLQNAAAGGTGR